MLIILSSCNLFAQIEKGNILISGFGSYIKTATESGVTTNRYSSNIKSLNTGASFGYFLKDRFIAGVGVEYLQTKEVRNNFLYINKYFQEEQFHTKNQGLLPFAYIGYYYPIIPKLSFNTNLKISYGQIKSEYQTMYAGSEMPLNDQYAVIVTPYLKSRSEYEEIDYFEAQITPELTYNLAKKFSVYLGLGGISYSMIDMKTANSNWLVSFNPNYWTLGIKCHL